MRLSDFEVLTFDTYGTLIDWETGLLTALEPLLALAPERPDAGRVLEEFGVLEAGVQAEHPALLYSEVLAEVHRRLAARWELSPPADAAAAFGASVGDWPAFSDSADALAWLGRDRILATVTNCDRASYAGSSERLGNPWDAIWTAEDIGSYKPDPRNFAFMIAKVREEFGRDKDTVLHVAQSLFHDHVPAQAAGLKTVWIDRRAGQEGGGATAAAEGARYDWRFTSMAEFVEAIKAEA